MKDIVLGSIGSGVIVHSIMDNVARVDGIRLGAVYSRTLEKARELADQYGADRVYTDMDEFLKDGETDFIYIATPNTLHYEQVKRALLAGKNVICEKPFATTYAKAKELVDIARDKGLVLIDATPTAYLPNLQIMLKELKNIGPIRLVMGNYSQYSSRVDLLHNGELPNIFNPEYGGGCLMDINYYNVYLTTLLFGRPAEAKYHPNLYDVKGGRIDTSGTVLMSYDGYSASLAGAKDTWGVNYFQIEGEKGYIYVEGGSNGLAGIHVVTKDKDETYNDQPDPDRWYYEVEALARMLQAKDYTTLDRGLDVMLEVMAVLEDLRRGAGIVFPGD